MRHAVVEMGRPSRNGRTEQPSERGCRNARHQKITFSLSASKKFPLVAPTTNLLLVTTDSLGPALTDYISVVNLQVLPPAYRVLLKYCSIDSTLTIHFIIELTTIFEKPLGRYSFFSYCCCRFLIYNVANNFCLRLIEPSAGENDGQQFFELWRCFKCR